MARLFVPASSQYLSRAAAVVTAPPFTMGCWFRADVDPDVGSLGLMTVGTAGSLNHAWWLCLVTDAAGNPVGFRARVNSGAATTTIFSTTGYSLDTWHHACAVAAAADDRRVYIDGGSKATSSVSRVVSGVDTTLIGARLNSAVDSFMSGRIAEAGIWNVALSDGEVAALAEGVSPLKIRPESIVAYWPIFGEYSPEPSVSGFAPLTLNGAPAAAPHVRNSPWWAREDDFGEFVAAGGHTVAIGIAVETDSALSLTAQKVLAVGIASEADAGLAITAAKQAALGIASETDSALAFTAQKSVAIGIAEEIDTALSFGQSQVVAVGQALETDTALAITGAKQAAIGIGEETDTAFPFTAVKIVSLGIATEADTALALTVSGGAAAVALVRAGIAVMTFPGARLATLRAAGHRDATLTAAGHRPAVLKTTAGDT